MALFGVGERVLLFAIEVLVLPNSMGRCLFDVYTVYGHMRRDQFYWKE